MECFYMYPIEHWLDSSNDVHIFLLEKIHYWYGPRIWVCSGFFITQMNKGNYDTLSKFFFNLPPPPPPTDDCI